MDNTPLVEATTLKRTRTIRPHYTLSPDAVNLTGEPTGEMTTATDHKQQAGGADHEPEAGGADHEPQGGGAKHEPQGGGADPNADSQDCDSPKRSCCGRLMEGPPQIETHGAPTDLGLQKPSSLLLLANADDVAVRLAREAGSVLLQLSVAPPGAEPSKRTVPSNARPAETGLNCTGEDLGYVFSMELGGVPRYFDGTDTALKTMSTGITDNLLEILQSGKDVKYISSARPERALWFGVAGGRMYHDVNGMYKNAEDKLSDAELDAKFADMGTTREAVERLGDAVVQFVNARAHFLKFRSCTFMVDLIDGLAAMLAEANPCGGDYEFGMLEFKKTMVAHHSEAKKLPLMGVGEKDLTDAQAPKMEVLFVREREKASGVVGVSYKAKADGFQTLPLQRLTPWGRMRNIETMIRLISGEATKEDKAVLETIDWTLITDNSNESCILNDIDDAMLKGVLECNGIAATEHCVNRRMDIKVPVLDDSAIKMNDTGIFDHLELNRALYYSATAMPQTELLKQLRDGTAASAAVAVQFKALGMDKFMRNERVNLGVRDKMPPTTLFMGDDMRDKGIKLPLVIGSGRFDGFVAQLPIGNPAEHFREFDVPSLAHVMIADRSEHANINTSLPCTSDESEREFLMHEFCDFAYRLYSGNHPIREAGDEVVAKGASLGLKPDTRIQTYVVKMVANVEEDVRKGRPGYKIYLPGKYDAEAEVLEATKHETQAAHRSDLSTRREELIQEIMKVCFDKECVPTVFYQPPESISMVDKHWHMVPIPAKAMGYAFGRTRFKRAVGEEAAKAAASEVDEAAGNVVTTTGTYLPVRQVLAAKRSVRAVDMSA